MKADENRMPEQSQFDWEKLIYNPFVDRNVRILMHSRAIANRDIPAGSEIHDNDLNYAGPTQWKSSVLRLRAQCATEEVVVAPE
jgi:hypothetical protein